MNRLNKRIGRLGSISAAAFILLIVNLTYTQFIAASQITARTQNIRPLLNGQKIKRGDIISADGEILAASSKIGDRYKRHYPTGEVTAPVTGFFSYKYGRAGLELTYDEYLSGSAKVSSFDDYLKHLLGKDAPGNDLVLTIDMDVQRLAEKALGENKGAAVVLDPRTGAVLALVSKPSYDPGKLDEHWSYLTTSPDGIMVNRATQGRFTPGSSFKIVTAAAAVEGGLVSTSTAYNAPSQLKIYGGKVSNYKDKNYGKISFTDAFAKSVNTVFAQVGKDLGGPKLVGISRDFGFNTEIPFDLPTSRSSVPEASEMDDLEVAWMAVGQGRVQVSPLGMAMVGSAIANGGKIMRPYLVKTVFSQDGKTLFKQRPRVWLNPVSEKTAATLKFLMENTVDKGTGKSAKIASVRVAGKTGTAEVGKKRPHSWFVGFAPVDDPRVVVAVIIENGGPGGSVAAPAAREILISVLGKKR